MKLPGLVDYNFKNKKVLLRLSLDVPLEVDPHGHLEIKDTTRIDESLETINFLIKQKPKQIIVLSHLGRPKGKVVPELSLQPVAQYLDEKIGRKVKAAGIEFYLRENLRFDKGEIKNSLVLAKKMARGMDVFVNEAFAVAHRRHASVVGLTKLLPTFFGFDFLKEWQVLSELRQNPDRPVVLLLGGAKRDKIELAKKLIYWADFVLVGGKLVEYDGLPVLAKHPKVIGSLTHDGKDINEKAVKVFIPILKKAKTIIWAGPMGAFEEKKSAKGTEMIGKLVAGSKAFKVIGGGDTKTALSSLNLIDKMDYVSSGGGAMLYFLAHGNLPALERLKNDKDSD